MSSDISSIFGTYLYIILNNYVNIESSSFTNGYAYKGGAIFSQGDSSIIIKDTNFTNNIATSFGGSFIGSDFSLL